MEQKQVQPLGRGEALALVLGSLNGGASTTRELSEKTGHPQTRIGAAIYKLQTQGRVRSCGIRDGLKLYERVPGAEQADVRAIVRAPKSNILDRVLNLLGQFEAQQKEEAAELGRLREENARLRRSLKELAGKL